MMDQFKSLDTWQIVAGLAGSGIGFLAGKKFGKGNKYAPWIGVAAGFAVGYFGYGLVVPKQETTVA